LMRTLTIGLRLPGILDEVLNHRPEITWDP